jgi:hypothetical protein
MFLYLITNNIANTYSRRPFSVEKKLIIMLRALRQLFVALQLEVASAVFSLINNGR